MSYKSIWIENEALSKENRASEYDGITDVIVTLDDDSKWFASFFSYQEIASIVEKNKQTGECLSGKYLWATDLVMTDEVSRARIEEVVSHLLCEDPLEFNTIFSRIGETTAEEASAEKA